MPQVQENRGFEYEYRDDADNPGFSGYFATFNRVDSHGSAFGRSAFKKTLRERGDRLPVLFNHDPDKVIGTVTSTRSDSKGAFFDSRIIEGTTWGKDVMTLVRSGALGGMSFGFRPIKERSATKDDLLDFGEFRGAKPEDIRFIEEVSLKEISAATFPSNIAAGITKYRSEDEEYEVIIEELRAIGIDDEGVEKLLVNIREIRSATPPDNGPSDDTHEDESRDDDLDLDIAIALMGITE